MCLQSQALSCWPMFYQHRIVAWSDQWLKRWALNMMCLLEVRQTSELKGVSGLRLSSYTIWSMNAANINCLKKLKVPNSEGLIKDSGFTSTTMAMFTDLMLTVHGQVAALWTESTFIMQCKTNCLAWLLLSTLTKTLKVAQLPSLLLRKHKVLWKQ